MTYRVSIRLDVLVGVVFALTTLLLVSPESFGACDRFSTSAAANAIRRAQASTTSSGDATATYKCDDGSTARRVDPVLVPPSSSPVPLTHGQMSDDSPVSQAASVTLEPASSGGGSNASSADGEGGGVDVEVPAPVADLGSRLANIFPPYRPQEVAEAKFSARALRIDPELDAVAPTTEDREFAAKFDRAIDDVLDRIGNETQALMTHTKYNLLKLLMTEKLDSRRREASLVQSRTRCLEFVRTAQAPDEAIYRVPCVPWNLPHLHSISIKSFGAVARFSHIPPPTSLPATKFAPAVKSNPLKVAVEMSGHMRTYKRCYKSLVANLLAPNQALLFIATYPDLGEKRYGIRMQEFSDEVPMSDLVSMYSPYLAQAYMLDLPTLTRKLSRWFASYFQLKQWSWMIFQLFTMELAHNTTLAHMPSTAADIEAADPTVVRHVVPGRAAPPVWPDFDIVIRVRPDLYILGEALVRAMTPTTATFLFTCDGKFTFVENFTRNDIIRAPHHPVFEWVSDPISDHSAIGFTKELTSFMHLFNTARSFSPTEQGWYFFHHGNTAERMWTKHVQARKLNVIRTIGWHVMLRNPKVFFNSTVKVANTARRAQLTEKIFGVTDPEQVGCPRPDRSMERLGKKPHIGRTTRRR